LIEHRDFLYSSCIQRFSERWNHSADDA